MPRPERLVAVLGTGTEVGKTWVGAALARALRHRGLAVAARKPAQSFEPGARTDADELAAATGAAPHEVCPPARWYEVPMAPPMASEALGRGTFRVDDLVAELTWPEGAAVGLVEGAGGVRSPLAADGDNRDLVAALAPDLVVLVAHAGLGTINDVRLAADALAGHEVVVVLNRYEPGAALHVANRAWLAVRDGQRVVATVTELVDVVTGATGAVRALRTPD